MCYSCSGFMVMNILTMPPCLVEFSVVEFKLSNILGLALVREYGVFTRLC